MRVRPQQFVWHVSEHNVLCKFVKVNADFAKRLLLKETKLELQHFSSFHMQRLANDRTLLHKVVLKVQ